MFGRKHDHDIDVWLLVPLFLHSVLVQMIIPLVRVGTSYRALEIEIPVVWIGIIAASFAMLPVLFAIPIGKMMDRGHDSRAAQGGAVFILIGSLMLWLAPDGKFQLLFANVVLGIGHLLCMAAHQVISVRTAGPKSREAVFGYYMMGLAVGQGLGPFVMGLAAGDARVAPTNLLFLLGVFVALASLVTSLTLRSAPPKPPRAADEERLGVLAIFNLKGLPAIVFASVMTVTVFDLMVVYMPLLGAERHIDASQIGWLLMVRAIASMASRFAYVSLFRIFGRIPLTIGSMLLAAAGLVVLAFPAPLWMLYIASVAIGYGLGASSTLAFSGMVELAPANVRATALSLRLTGNRVGQVVLPFSASLLAAFTGVGGVFAVVALALVAAAAAVQRSWPKDRR
ncbi:MAG: major facilitator transporter [Hyphomicrobiales bacterium]|nr:major facilitator transporter [Hyphomicrobiales bacterium]